MSLVMNLGVCAILWVGGIQVNVGELTQGPRLWRL